MQTADRVVHAVTALPSAVLAAVEKGFGGSVAIRHWDVVPPLHAIPPGDLVVVDPTDFHRTRDVDRIRSLASRAEVFLVVEEGPISASWLTLIERGEDVFLRVIRCGTDQRMKGYPSLVSMLAGRLRGLSGEEVARLVLEHEPFFEPVAPLVSAICRDPWGLRRPKELARAVGVAHRWLRESCRALGFTRVEHLMIAVRMVALELLVRERRLTLSIARRQVGISNPTNARGQLQRARRRSIRAFRQLKWLVAGLLLALLGAVSSI
jgi:hypothetical protein